MKIPLHRSVLIGVALAGICVGCPYSAAALATCAGLQIVDGLTEWRCSATGGLRHES